MKNLKKILNFGKELLPGKLFLQGREIDGLRAEERRLNKKLAKLGREGYEIRERAYDSFERIKKNLKRNERTVYNLALEIGSNFFVYDAVYDFMAGKHAAGIADACLYLLVRGSFNQINKEITDDLRKTIEYKEDKMTERLTHIIDVTDKGNNVKIHGFNRLGKSVVVHDKRTGHILYEGYEGFKSDSGYEDLKKLFGKDCLAKDMEA